MSVSRIGRVRSGEKVIVPIISEKLQDDFDNLYKLRCELDGIGDKIKEGYKSPDDYCENAPYEESKYTHQLVLRLRRAEMDFWEAINDQYGVWNKCVGVRDGYCLVTLPPSKAIAGMRTIFENLKKLIENAEGENESFF